MKEYYHYTVERFIASIKVSGMYSNSHFYTTDQYFNAYQAGQAVGVMAANIDCVLLFEDDGKFKPYFQPVVPSANRFSGGATQFVHPQRPKPIAKRKITERNWTRL